jgi:hypothetical protein
MFCQKAAGISLLEVLISLVLLSIALFGFDVMEISAVRDNRAAYFSSVAMNQMQSMVERLHALGKHQGLDQQITAWNNELQSALPRGNGVVIGSFPTYTVIVSWGGLARRTCEEIKWGQAGCLKEKVKL